MIVSTAILSYQNSKIDLSYNCNPRLNLSYHDILILYFYLKIIEWPRTQEKIFESNILHCARIVVRLTFVALKEISKILLNCLNWNKWCHSNIKHNSLAILQDNLEKPTITHTQGLSHLLLLVHMKNISFRHWTNMHFYWITFPFFKTRNSSSTLQYIDFYWSAKNCNTVHL